MALEDTLKDISNKRELMSKSISSLQLALEDAAEQAELMSKQLTSAPDDIATKLQQIVLDPDRPTASLPFVFEDQITEKIATFRSRQDAIAETIDRLGETLDDLVAAGEGFAENLESTLDDHLQESSEHFEALVSELATQSERLGEGFDEVRDEAGEKFDSLEEKVQSFLKDVLQDKQATAIDNATEALEDTLRDCSVVIQEISDELKQSLADSLETLVDHARNSAEAAIESAGRRLIEILRDRLEAEATDAVLEMQIGAQLTAMLQPYLPQLMVASAVAPAVQKALDIMRAGV